jgi:predicted kinase
MQTGEDTMKERIMSRIRRKQDPSDAGLDTLAHQIATHEALAEHEQNYVINVPAQWDTDEDSLRSALAPVFGALGCRPQPAAPAVLPPN